MVRPALLAFTLSFTAATLSSAQDPLDERIEAARASSALRRAYFDAIGDPPLTVEQAFPHLAGAPLADPSFLANRRQLLATRTDACARERLEAPANRVARVGAVCDAEDAAARFEEQLIAALTVGLELAPGFTVSSIERARRPWREARERASGMAEDDEGLPEASRAALAASEAERRLLLYQTSALRRMTIPSDTALDHIVEADLSARDQGVELDADASDRVRRAAPLVSVELAASIERTVATGRDPAGQLEQPSSPDPGELGAPAREATTTTEIDPLQSPATFRENEIARHARTVESIQSLESRYISLEAELTKTRALTILDSGRSRRMQEVSRGVGELLASIRAAFETLANSRQNYDRQRRQLLARNASDRSSTDAAAELEAALDERRANTIDEAHALLSLERRTLVLRRTLAPLVREPLTSQVFVDELTEELVLAPAWLELEWSEDVRWLRSLPQRATEWNGARELLRLSFDLFALALMWFYARRQSARWLRRLSEIFQKKEVSSFGFSHRRPHLADRELEPVARYATDALGAFILHRLLEPRSEILAMLALVWVGVALLRSVPAAIRLVLPLLGRALDPLEAEGDPPTEVLTLGERTSNWFLRWWIASTIAAFIAVPLLQADRMLQLVSALSWTVFVLLAVIALAQWTPWVRHFIANLADQSAITVWLARPVRSKLQRMGLSAIGGVYVVLRLGFWALVDRGWLTRSGTSIALSRLEVADANAEHLSVAGQERIRALEAATIERTPELEIVRGAFEAWQRERRRGIVAVIGDRGMGKSVFLEQAGGMLDGLVPDIAITKLELPARNRSAGLLERFSWLTVPLGIVIAKNANRDTLQTTLIAHLESLPPRVFLVDDLHLLLRRTVGGFDDLELARNVIQACANEHFWVLSLHRPAWIYVDGVSTAMKMAFRDRIELPALDADALGSSLVDRTRAAGYEPEFRNLLKGTRPHVDKDALEQKARTLYWRLVSQSSNGNPRIVGDFWLQSLGSENGDGAEPPQKLPVCLFAGHRDDEIEDLSDEYLFLLTALVVHDGMKVEDLADVLNLARSKVRVTCQHLEGLGIIEYDRRRYMITTLWQPTVVRVLDRRNFAHR